MRGVVTESGKESLIAGTSLFIEGENCGPEIKPRRKRNRAGFPPSLTPREPQPQPWAGCTHATGKHTDPVSGGERGEGLGACIFFFF